MSEWKGPYGRRELARQFGAATMDRVNLHWDCPPCAQPVDDPDFYSVGTADYRSFDELIEASRQALGLAQLAERTCPTCERPATLRAADYHTYQPNADRDLVIRWRHGQDAPSLWFWDDAGYRATASMFDEEYDELLFHDDTALRRAASRFESEGAQAALPDLVAAASHCEDWWEMLQFVVPLAEHGRADVARRIARAYVMEHADEVDDGDASDEALARFAQAQELLAALPDDE